MMWLHARPKIRTMTVRENQREKCIKKNLEWNGIVAMLMSANTESVRVNESGEENSKSKTSQWFWCWVCVFVFTTLSMFTFPTLCSRLHRRAHSMFNVSSIFSAFCLPCRCLDSDCVSPSVDRRNEKQQNASHLSFDHAVKHKQNRLNYLIYCSFYSKLFVLWSTEVSLAQFKFIRLSSLPSSHTQAHIANASIRRNVLRVCVRSNKSVQLKYSHSLVHSFVQFSTAQWDARNVRSQIEIFNNERKKKNKNAFNLLVRMANWISKWNETH